MNRKKLSALALAGALALGLLTPAPAAAAANKVVEIPVNFTNTDWGEKDDWDTSSKTDLNLWGLGEDAAYAGSYDVSFRLYVPTSYIRDGSAINISGNLNFDAEVAPDDWKGAGWMDFRSTELQSNGEMTVWNEETQKDEPSDCASVKKTGGYYVISYQGKTMGELQTNEETEADVTKAEKVGASFNLAVKGMMIDARGAVYVDDIKIIAAGGTVVMDEGFDSIKSLKDHGQTVFNSNYDEEGAPLTLTTLPDTTVKTLTVAKKKLTVKVGKKVTIKATAKPAAKITYKSSNKKIAAVNAKGVVTGKKAGKATITVKANGKSVKVAVTVKK